MAATSFPAPFEADRQAEFIQELNERYTDVLLYCSTTLESEAQELYGRALKALEEPDDVEDDPSREDLRKARDEFWFSVREEAQEDYFHS